MGKTVFDVFLYFLKLLLFYTHISSFCPFFVIFIVHLFSYSFAPFLTFLLLILLRTNFYLLLGALPILLPGCLSHPCPGAEISSLCASMTDSSLLLLASQLSSRSILSHTHDAS